MSVHIGADVFSFDSCLYTLLVLQVSEHLCADGLVFDETSTTFAICGFPFSIDCTGGFYQFLQITLYLMIQFQADLNFSQLSPVQGVPEKMDILATLMKLSVTSSPTV